MELGHQQARARSGGDERLLVRHVCRPDAPHGRHGLLAQKLSVQRAAQRVELALVERKRSSPTNRVHDTRGAR